MSEKNKIGRRVFMGTSLMGVGGALGWLVGRPKNAPRKIPTDKQELPQDLVSSFDYDLSAYEKTDRSLLLYTEDDSFPLEFQRVARMTVTPDDRILAAGDKSVKIFDANGGMQLEVSLDRLPHCLYAGEEEFVVSHWDRFLIYDYQGNLKSKTESLGEKVYITALTLDETGLFVADAGNREVFRCDREGNIEFRFGKKDPSLNNPGFAVPSPFFDLKLASDGNLRIVNPGRLRMETYTTDGRFQGSWGQPGIKIDRFCGCCNPVYFALTPDGSFITSEKGLARINVYDPEGNFKGVVAGPDMLVEGSVVKKSSPDEKIGLGFDVSVDSSGRVLVMDPYKKTIRVFAPKATV